MRWWWWWWYYGPLAAKTLARGLKFRGWGVKRRGRGNVRGRHCRGSIQGCVWGRRRLVAALVGGEVEEE